MAVATDPRLEEIRKIANAPATIAATVPRPSMSATASAQPEISALHR